MDGLFLRPANNAGLPPAHHRSTGAAATHRLLCLDGLGLGGQPARQAYSYTNNFPYDPPVGNVATTDARAVERAEPDRAAGRDRAGAVRLWPVRLPGLEGRSRGARPPAVLPGGDRRPASEATIKYFVVVAVLFLAQALVGRWSRTTAPTRELLWH